MTYEFENVPVAAAEMLSALKPVSPPPRALEVAQDRLVEKQFIAGLGSGIAKRSMPLATAIGLGAAINVGLNFALIPLWGRDGAAWATLLAYTASKGGVVALTREIAAIYARQNIRANALCPGPVATPLLAKLVAEPAARARRLVHVPPGRFARAEEVAQAALFLASDESAYVNGTAFVVDGGITATYITPE